MRRARKLTSDDAFTRASLVQLIRLGSFHSPCSSQILSPLLHYKMLQTLIHVRGVQIYHLYKIDHKLSILSFFQEIFGKLKGINIILLLLFYF